MNDELTNQPQSNEAVPPSETPPSEADYSENGAEAEQAVDNAPAASAPTAAPPQPPTMPEDDTANKGEAVKASAPATNNASSGVSGGSGEQGYDERLERLGGEPAPVITPEEFARLQKAGQVHIDARGRVRTTRREDADGGVSLRKRRAWYQAKRWYR